jgi:hypothetical protein
MESAKTNLQNAKANLMAAEHNKEGHRTKAINLINSAIAEVNRGINFARQNNHVIMGSFAGSRSTSHGSSAEISRKRKSES